MNDKTSFDLVFNILNEIEKHLAELKSEPNYFTSNLVHMSAFVSLCDLLLSLNKQNKPQSEVQAKNEQTLAPICWSLIQIRVKPIQEKFAGFHPIVEEALHAIATGGIIPDRLQFPGQSIPVYGPLQTTLTERLFEWIKDAEQA